MNRRQQVTVVAVMIRISAIRKNQITTVIVVEMTNLFIIPSTITTVGATLTPVTLVLLIAKNIIVRIVHHRIVTIIMNTRYVTEIGTKVIQEEKVIRIATPIIVIIIMLVVNLVTILTIIGNSIMGI
jgi:hypothetical protein|tara:strand:+ start:265 stop:645 length:381 start_codon:yes stop_codon:yes gene_type:complete